MALYRGKEEIAGRKVTAIVQPAKLYDSGGNNTDGGLTQKAATELVDSLKTDLTNLKKSEISASANLAYKQDWKFQRFERYGYVYNLPAGTYTVKVTNGATRVYVGKGVVSSYSVSGIASVINETKTIAVTISETEFIAVWVDSNEKNNTISFISIAKGNTATDEKWIPSVSVISDEVESLNDSLDELNETLMASNAGAHNCVYRGKYLGSSVTSAQYSAISSGAFTDLYIGDYWTIGGVNYRIASFDYYLNTGDVACTTHHAVIVPDTCLYNHAMNNSNVTTGGYVGSKMYAEGLEIAKNIINTAFIGHVLKHRVYLTNAVSNGKASACAWYDSEVDLMNEQMVYGTGIFSPVSDGSNVPANYRVEKSQLPLFAHEPSRIVIRNNYWLRDVLTAAHFAYVATSGLAYCGTAGYSLGIRPAFCIS